MREQIQWVLMEVSALVSHNVASKLETSMRYLMELVEADEIDGIPKHESPLTIPADPLWAGRTMVPWC